MTTKRTVRLAAAAAALALTLAACSSDDHDMDSMPGMNQSGGMTSSTAGSEQSDHNAADAMFAQMMIPHHAQAVEMSDIVLAKDGVDPEVVTLAEEIKAAQAPEIELMTDWLEAWGMPVMSTGMGDMDHGMDGMMSAEDMQALADADGAEASRLFLEQMIVHHEGAIEMAEAVLEDGSNADVEELANAIVATQQSEIDRMRELLGQR